MGQIRCRCYEFKRYVALGHADCSTGSFLPNTISLKRGLRKAIDEVTGAPDPHTEQNICRNIDALSHDMTVLAITYREAWTEIAERTCRLD